MNKNLQKAAIILSITLSIFSNELLAQTTRFWVNFTDKNGTPYTVSNPSAFLGPKSIIRRLFYNIPVDATDLPVTPSYVASVSAVPGATIVYVSKWHNGAVVAVTNTNVMANVNALPFVSGSTPVNKLRLEKFKEDAQPVDLAGRSANNLAVASPSAYYGGSYWQNKQLGVDCLHDQGYRGQNMLIAVLDAGFNNVDVNPVFDSLRNRGGIIGTRDFVAGGNSVYEDDQHGAMVLSCMAAIKPNFICGSAPRADYWLLRTEQAATELIIEEYNWIRGAEFADSVGADILTTSLGYTTFDIPSQNHTFADLNGTTSKMSIASRMAVRKGMFVLNSAGNGNGGPWPKIGIPADADSICTVGAIDSLYNIAGFSSLGPTADGRIKPDLVARGSKAWVSFPNGSVGYSNGTSFSCPILAGAVACFWQAHNTWNSKKILDTLKHTASFSLTPNNIRGWGTTNMCAIPPIVQPPVKVFGNTMDKENLKAYPNPFTNSIQVNFPENKFEKLVVLNGLGEIVRTIDVKNGSNKNFIQLSELAAGMYFIKAEGKDQSECIKIIKQ
jgi:serine protease AprX